MRAKFRISQSYREMRTNEPLTESGQLALRSELAKLMRIASIARPGALYGASVSAQTSEAIGNPSDFEEISDANMASAASAVDYPHMSGCGGYGRKFKKRRREANRANLLKGVKCRQIENPFRISKFGVFAKSD